MMDERQRHRLLVKVPLHMLRILTNIGDEILLHLMAYTRRHLQNDFVQARGSEDIDVVTRICSTTRYRWNRQMR